MPPRKIPVPTAERDYLRTLSGSALRARACALHAAGWPLAAIGEALDPPRPRSTVHSWVSSSAASSSIAAAEKSASAPDAPPVPSLSDAALAPYDLTATAAASSFSIGAADISSPPSPSRARSRPYTSATAALTEPERLLIGTLAPVARRYRSRSNPRGDIARANEELTSLCRAAHARGASIPELASAAGVTYKAMERRVRGRR